MCINTPVGWGPPADSHTVLWGILSLSAQLLNGPRCSWPQMTSTCTRSTCTECVLRYKMPTFFVYVRVRARVPVDLEWSCRSTDHLNHQPSLWTLLSISHPPPLSLSAEFCVLLVAAPISPLVQRRRSHPFAKIRWPRVFSLSPRTPMLIVGTTRQVQREPNVKSTTNFLKFKAKLPLNPCIFLLWYSSWHTTSIVAIPLIANAYIGKGQRWLHRGFPICASPALVPDL